MEMLTGKGNPSKYLKAEVGAHYKNTDTGDIFECVSANKHSRINLHQTGGYIWKKVARGEHVEVCGGGSGDTAGSGGDEKAWVIYSPEDDDVNYVIGEYDTVWTESPVIIGWDVLKALKPNEIMRRLTADYGEAACTGVDIRWGVNDDPDSIYVSFRTYMNRSSNDTKLSVQDSYFSITSSGVEFLGRTPPGEEITLVGGTLRQE